MRRIRGRFGAVAVIVCLLPGATAWGSNGKGQATGVSSLPAEAQASISAALGRDLPAYRVRKQDGALEVRNAKQRLTTEFSARGVVVRTGNAHWGMRLLGYGYGEALRTAKDAAPHASANRVEYRRGPITEWYVNGPLGLEQGFTISKRPGNGGGQPLTIALTLSGELTPGADNDGKGLTLAGNRGVSLRYSSLTAHEARGKPLRAWMELQGERLLLKVNDAGARYPVVVDPILQLAQLSASDAFFGSGFGGSVAISGNTVVVGMPSKNQARGAAYVFVKPETGWSNITQTATLTASDGMAGFVFGRSVDVSGNTVVVGASEATIGSKNQGAAYVFTEPATGWTNMIQTAKLTASDGANDDNFGYSVGITGNTIVVGAFNAGGSGRAYVFVEPAGGWAPMTQTAELSAAFGQDGDSLGSSVAISGNTVVAGLPGWNNPLFQTGQGAVDVFVMPETSWRNMTETAELIASDGEFGDELGLSVAISGGTIVSGAPFATVGFVEYQGAAYVFVMPVTGWADAYQTAKLNVTDGQSRENLASSVGISARTIVVGAPAATVGDKETEGAAYLYSEPASGWADMTQTAKLIDAQGITSEDFGSSVGLADTTSIVGAPSANVNGHPRFGAAYIFGP